MFSTVVFAVLPFLHMAAASTCSFPDPAPNFKNEDYVGRWFEIGKIQTKGGAFFERNCVCTELGISITNPETVMRCIVC